MVWVVVVIAAIVFLGWFGNYTAAMYRRMYGSLPEIEKFYGGERKQDRPAVECDMAYTAVGMCSSAVVSPYVWIKNR